MRRLVRSAILDRIVDKDFLKGDSEQRSNCREKVIIMWMEGRYCPGSGNSKYKCPKADACLLRSRTARRPCGRNGTNEEEMIGNEVRKISRYSED